MWKDTFDHQRLVERVLKPLQGPNLPGTIVGLLVAAVIALSCAIWLPTETSIRRTMKVLAVEQLPATDTHTHGCGKYWHTETIGRGIGASIQLAAEVCWDGTNVRWIWGLHRGDCRPLSYILARVKMTCQISGGHKTPLVVRYTTRVAPAFMPFMERTVTVDLTVTPQGYILRFPYETV